MTAKKAGAALSLKPLDVLFGSADTESNGIRDIRLDNLHSFVNHPYHVKDDEEMMALVDTVRASGVLMPGLVRPRAEGGYEIVSGHRRKRACEIAGLDTMPVIKKNLTDDEAIIIMVNSNIQRENLLFSEKAHAYKMRYDAMKRQGRRSDLTTGQLDQRLRGLTTAEIMAKEGESEKQIRRYIHLTELIPELLEMTDVKRIPFNTAVEISYLKKEKQRILLSFIQSDGKIPSLIQARRLKVLDKEEELTDNLIAEVFNTANKNDLTVRLKSDTLHQYFPPQYTVTQIEEVIEMLLKEWSSQLNDKNLA